MIADLEILPSTLLEPTSFLPKSNNGMELHCLYGIGVNEILNKYKCVITLGSVSLGIGNDGGDRWIDG